MPGQESTPQGYIWCFETFRAAFPDLKNVDHIAANEDNVSIAYTITGTHKGDFQAVFVTGSESRRVA